MQSKHSPTLLPPTDSFGDPNHSAFEKSVQFVVSINLRRADMLAAIPIAAIEAEAALSERATRPLLISLGFR